MGCILKKVAAILLLLPLILMIHGPVVTAGVTSSGESEVTFTVVEQEETDECFIATAALGSNISPSVTLLRQFRDAKLLTNRPGQVFVSFYYSISPPIAEYIAGSAVLKKIVTVLLIPFIVVAYLFLHQWLMFMIVIPVLAVIFSHVVRREVL